MVYIPNWCSFSLISISRLVIPLKQAREEKEGEKNPLFPKQGVCHQFAVALFASTVQIFLHVQLSLSPLDVPGSKTHRPEEISVPCQPTASADGTDAFSLLPVDSHSLIFHTKLPTA